MMRVTSTTTLAPRGRARDARPGERLRAHHVPAHLHDRQQVVDRFREPASPDERAERPAGAHRQKHGAPSRTVRPTSCTRCSSTMARNPLPTPATAAVTSPDALPHDQRDGPSATPNVSPHQASCRVRGSWSRAAGCAFRGIPRVTTDVRAPCSRDRPVRRRAFACRPSAPEGVRARPGRLCAKAGPRRGTSRRRSKPAMRRSFSAEATRQHEHRREVIDEGCRPRDDEVLAFRPVVVPHQIDELAERLRVVPERFRLPQDARGLPLVQPADARTS